MTIIERFEALTPEKKQQTLLVIQKKGLDAFLSETGVELSAEEKAATVDYFKANKVELSDEEMEAATGGAWFEKCPNGRWETEFIFTGTGPCTNGCSHYLRERVNLACDEQRCTYFNVVALRYIVR